MFYQPTNVKEPWYWLPPPWLLLATDSEVNQIAYNVQEIWKLVFPNVRVLTIAKSRILVL